MLFMLFVILFVLFAKVMPIFESVYEQLGAQISPVARSAIRMGGLFSGAALALILAAAVVALILYVASRFGKSFHLWSGSWTR